MGLVNALNEAISLLEQTREDATKAENGNKSAGVRVRKTAKTVMDELKELRRLVLECRQ